MIRTIGICTLVAAATLSAGCATTPKYACGLPKGVTCMPISAVYRRAVSGTLHETRSLPTDEQANKRRENIPTREVRKGEDVRIVTVHPSDPILTRPHVQRIWIRRFEDKDGDLHDETYVYLRLDAGTWRLR